MLIVASQASFLQWDGEKLWLDAGPEDVELLAELVRLATPDQVNRKADASQEILQLGRQADMLGVPLPAVDKEIPQDEEFTEGKKVRKEHLRRERNRKLVKRFFESLAQPVICDLCGRNVNARYPWLRNLLEAHHVLPLSSPLRADSSGTKLAELVPICPNCHRAVHAYYRVWLKANGIDDFRTPDESAEVYREARTKVKADS